VKLLTFMLQRKGYSTIPSTTLQERRPECFIRARLSVSCAPRMKVVFSPGTEWSPAQGFTDLLSSDEARKRCARNRNS
jgi:hypothetical protein